MITSANHPHIHVSGFSPSLCSSTSVTLVSLLLLKCAHLSPTLGSLQLLFLMPGTLPHPHSRYSHDLFLHILIISNQPPKTHTQMPKKCDIFSFSLPCLPFLYTTKHSGVYMFLLLCCYFTAFH